MPPSMAAAAVTSSLAFKIELCQSLDGDTDGWERCGCRSSSIGGRSTRSYARGVTPRASGGGLITWEQRGRINGERRKLDYAGWVPAEQLRRPAWAKTS